MTALPVDAYLPVLRAALNDHSQALLVAEPGAGKTTRVPLALLEEPWCRKGKLLVLEPRRVAARLAAGYMAKLLGESIGDTVGYRVRGESRVGSHTRIEVVTQGILLRLLQNDPLLEGVTGLIFDEFHERRLDADLSLALALDSQRGLREDLRLLVMSATLDVAALRRVLKSSAPLIECPGRSFPVITYYRPLVGRVAQERQRANLIREVLAMHSGDALVFLPGIADIRRLHRKLTNSENCPAFEVLELHGRLPLAQQQAALRRDPQGNRRIVLATSIAESSVTVDGVRIVIDAGIERVPIFQLRLGQTRLANRQINRASADQRQGRAARQAPGVCFRLWPQEQPLPAHPEPEIQQADLSGLAFELARWGINDSSQLDWVTPPPQAALRAGREQLKRLGILDSQWYLTALGRACGDWPCHPRLAVMLERASTFDAQPLACWITALLESRLADDGPDLADTLARLPSKDAKGAEQQWRKDAARLAKIAGCSLQVASLQPLGKLLALAYPERVGLLLEPGRFKLAAGGQAWVKESHSLAHAKALVAVELDGNPQGARIFRAASLDPASLSELFPEARSFQPRLEWSEAEGRLVGEEVRALGELILERRPLTVLPAQAVISALLAAVRKRGTLAFNPTARQLLGRVALMRRALSEPDDWPDWSLESLLATLEDWLAPRLDDIRRLDQLDRLPFELILLEGLEWRQRQQLDEWAPTHLEVPSGSRIRLDYTQDPPVLAVKLQEVFGLTQTPRVAQGRVPVVMHLLSPAGRPLQVTQDLTNFWTNGYLDVRKDMRGRYPKHPWPKDPSTAVPTVRTKRYQTG